MLNFKPLLLLLTLLVSLRSEAATLEDLIASARTNIGESFAQSFALDLEAIAKIRGDRVSKLNFEVFKSADKLNGEDYLNYFLDRVDQIKLDPDPNSTSVASYSRRTVYIGSNYLKAPAFARLNTLIHESAHGGDLRGHAYCPTPFLDENGKDRVSEMSGVKLEGKPACAERFADAYVTEYIFLKNIYLYCLNCSEKMKDEAKFFADKVLIRVVDAKIQEVLTKDK